MSHDLVLRGVILLALLVILLHLGLILYALIHRTFDGLESPWVTRLEVIRWVLAVLIGGLFLLALLTGCASPCWPRIPPDRISRLIQIHTLDSAVDSEIGIECKWRY